MRFEVKYAHQFSLRSGKILRFYGKGRIHLLETGLLAEGWRAKFRIPVLLPFYHPIFCEQSTLTIPYSRIKSYEPPSLLSLRRFCILHVSIFEPEQRLLFRVPGHEKAFAARLEEYVQIAKTWQKGA